jgi:hypothetical protein
MRFFQISESATAIGHLAPYRASPDLVPCRIASAPAVSMVRFKTRAREGPAQRELSTTSRRAQQRKNAHLRCQKGSPLPHRQADFINVGQESDAAIPGRLSGDVRS